MRARLQQRLSPEELSRLRRAGELAAGMGLRLFVTGGAVRDVILGRPHGDWDLVVEGSALDFARSLADEWLGRATLHPRFLTATVHLPDGTALDLATARREAYPRPGALPVVQTAAIEEDLWRRDFSVNAIALSLAPDSFAEALDPTGGLGDLDHGLVRALHPDSFRDDATRILRAIGFEQRLGFALEPQTEVWLRNAVAAGALQTVSSERLGEALLPLLGKPAGPQVLIRGAAMGVADAWGAREALSARPLRALQQAPQALEQLGEASPHARVTACLVALLRGPGVTADEIAACLHLQRPLARELRDAESWLRSWPAGFRPAATSGGLWRQLRGIGLGGITALWYAARQTGARAALAEHWTALRDAAPDISAEAFEPLGFRPGPAYSAALAAATEAKLSHSATREDQLAAAVAVLRSHPTQTAQKTPTHAPDPPKRL